MRYPSLNKEKKKNYSSMRNALRLLNLFSMDEPELNLSQLADKLEVGISTAHRLTYTLMNEGFLVKDPITKYYRLGASILAMGNTIISNNEICHISTPIIEQLAKETGETAHIAILKDNFAVYLNKIDSNNPVHLLSHSGRKNPLHSTSTGQVLLAFQSEEFIESIINLGLQPYTPNTITSKEKLKSLLQDIRKAGATVSVEEMNKGVSSIAAPILIAGKAIASVSIAGPTPRINKQNSPHLVKLVKQAAVDIANKYKQK